VLISSISGIIVEMRVKPGDNATIYCDCTYQSKFTLVWFIKPSNEHQPHLINLTEHSTPPRYSRVWNYTKGTYDLLVKNITESDLGLYYCALHEIKITRDRNRTRVSEDVYHEGNRTTFLSFLDATVPCTAPPQTPSTLQTTSTTPPVSDCSVCWKLLVSVCPACVLLSSVVSSTCVYCICRSRTKGTLSHVGDGGGGGGGGDVSYASLNILNTGQRRLKKRTAESSDLCTYSEVRTERM
ncbi:hypothetical protein NFI96_030787, partial [Prochilodus magdalenae]